MERTVVSTDCMLENVSESTKECISAVLAIEQISVDLQHIFTSTITAYNLRILETGGSLEMYLVQDKLGYEETLHGLCKMYKTRPKKSTACGYEWYRSAYLRVYDSILSWKKRKVSSVHAQGENNQNTGNRMVLLESNQILKEKALERLSLYVTRNIVEPFDRFFVDASVNNEREKTEELALQCKLVLDRRVGEYLGTESVLGWPLSKVKDILHMQLDRLDEEYQQMDLLLQDIEKEAVDPGMSAQRAEERFKIVLMEMLDASVQK